MLELCPRRQMCHELFLNSQISKCCEAANGFGQHTLPQLNFRSLAESRNSAIIREANQIRAHYFLIKMLKNLKFFQKNFCFLFEV